MRTTYHVGAGSKQFEVGSTRGNGEVLLAMLSMPPVCGWVSDTAREQPCPYCAKARQPRTMKVLLHDDTPAYLCHGGKQVLAEKLLEPCGTLGSK